MKWIYGKQELKNLERGQENCYLLTNGLGGFSSMTMTGSVARNDHALLMACVQAPNHRYNMVHRLKESLCLGEEEIVLSSQEFADGYKEEGCPYFSSFVFDDMPIWRFLVQGGDYLWNAVYFLCCCSYFPESAFPWISGLWYDYSGIYPHDLCAGSY